MGAVGSQSSQGCEKCENSGEVRNYPLPSSWLRTCSMRHAMHVLFLGAQELCEACSLAASTEQDVLRMTYCDHVKRKKNVVLPHVHELPNIKHLTILFLKKLRKRNKKKYTCRHKMAACHVLRFLNGRPITKPTWRVGTFVGTCLRNGFFVRADLRIFLVLIQNQ